MRTSAEWRDIESFRGRRSDDYVGCRFPLARSLAELGNAIAADPGDVEAALIAYETDLFPRSASAAAAAGGILELCLGLNAPHSLVDMLTSHSPQRKSTRTPALSKALKALLCSP
jgi:hypothetical protein